MIHTAHAYQPERLRQTSLVFFGPGGGPNNLFISGGHPLRATTVFPPRNAPIPRPKKIARLQDQLPGKSFLP